ncbi:DNA polymerase IV [Paenibacillus sp. LC231]|uniref:DNA polymerase IV n=1 Tax=Paenibacillus sp. LC231 TaxID=1120679 RepID=UPI00094293F2|nr:DNA polymerase IV [Paenibacillus sp. LC231]
MEDYIRYSLLITEIFEEYSDQVEPYSIDEQWIELNHYKMFGETIEEVAKQIQDRVMIQTGVRIRFGIAANKIGSKMACDMIAKKNESGIFHLRKEELQETIWKYKVEEMWGVGSRMKRHLNKMGIWTIGDLAKTPLPRLTRRWGVNGQVLWQCANMIDDAPVSPISDEQKAFGNTMTLPRDYHDAHDIETVLLELTMSVCRRARKKNRMGWVVSVGCQGADWDFPTGFHRQAKMEEPSNLTMEVFASVKKLFHRFWDGLPVRRVGVNLSELVDDGALQMSLFVDRDKMLRIEKTVDYIKDRFGETAILPASSFLDAGQAMERANRIGGHYK